MSTYFVDLDGVFFKYGTMEPTDGAVDVINGLSREGHQIIFTTARVYENNTPPCLNLRDTERVLKELGVVYRQIIGGVTNPRIVINDEGAMGINHERNAPLRI